MAKNDDKQRAVRCSFCGKHQDQVRRLIAGPGAYICNECVQLCMSILEDEHDTVQTAAVEVPDAIPTPQEIHKVLDQYIIGPVSYTHLVATSGDTGKGALEGFRDVDRTKILVFYPKDGVSAIQELQMVTQEGANVGVCSVVGNFDDAQTGVKRLFSDEELRERLARRGYFLSSANSINWGRVLPQIVYYISCLLYTSRCV